MKYPPSPPHKPTWLTEPSPTITSKKEVFCESIDMISEWCCGSTIDECFKVFRSRFSQNPVLRRAKSDDTLQWQLEFSARETYEGDEVTATLRCYVLVEEKNPYYDAQLKQKQDAEAEFERKMLQYKDDLKTWEAQEKDRLELHVERAQKTLRTAQSKLRKILKKQEQE